MSKLCFLQLVAASVASQLNAFSSPNELGRLRSEFGDPPRGRLAYVTCYRDQIDGATHLFFPFGVADRRYYLQGTTNALVLEVKKGKSVKVAWIAYLEFIPKGMSPEADKLKNMGTLEAMLARSNLRVKTPIDKRVRESLSAISCYAEYYVDITAGVFVCGHVERDGNEILVENHNYENPEVVFYGSLWKKGYRFPRTPYDYPISRAEKKELFRWAGGADGALQDGSVPDSRRGSYSVYQGCAGGMLALNRTEYGIGTFSVPRQPLYKCPVGERKWFQ